MAIAEAITNFKVYEDGSEYLGLAQVTLPTLTWMTQTISGSGIAGNVEMVIPGHVDAMSCSINFRTTTQKSITLTSPKRHTVELRADQVLEDPATGKITHRLEKHTMVVVPKTHNFGTVQAGSTTDGSGEFAVRYWKITIGGKVMQEIDPFNNICKINGVDYLAASKKNL